MTVIGIANPRLVQLVIDGTGADYSKVSEAIIDPRKFITEGLTIGGTTFYGELRGLDAELLERGADDAEETWKWRIYIQLAPRVQYMGNSNEPVREIDSATREVSTDLTIVREYKETCRRAPKPSF